MKRECGGRRWRQFGGSRYKYQFEYVTPEWKFAPIERYVAPIGGRRRTVRVRAQMFTYSKEKGEFGPPEGVSENAFFRDGFMYVPGYLRAASDFFIDGYLVYWGMEAVAFKTAKIEHWGCCPVYDERAFFFTQVGHVEVFDGHAYDVAKHYAMTHFYRFHEFSVKEAGRFDEWKRDRLESSPNFWRASVVEEGRKWYGGYECCLRYVLFTEKIRRRVMIEETARHCRSSGATARENQRQLRALGFVA